MKKIVLGIAFTLFVFTLGWAQSKSNSEKKADKYYEQYSFDKAIKRFTDVDSLGVDGLRKLAISYKNRNKFDKAEQTYERFVNTSQATPEDFFNYVLMLKANGKYDEANTWLTKLQTENPNDLRVKSFFETGSVFQTLLVDNKDYEIKDLNFNNKNDDFGTAYYKKQIVFASTRKSIPIISRIYNWTQTPFLDIVVSDMDSFELKKPKLFNKKISKKWHEGPASFARNGTLMAYTRDNYDGKSSDDVVKLQIFFSEYEKEQWSEPTPFYLNNPEYSVGHPCLNSRGNIMFFVSDMPGGYGGTDIYFVKKVGKDKWSEPINLGDKVNTEGNEMFPYYEERSGLLFFASNGRAGLGGLDVFVAVKTPKGFDMVENVGAPINSKWDDFAYIIDKKLKNGYFSSNRPTGKGGDDIYSFKFSGEFKKYVPKDSIFNYTYRLFVLNEETQQPIPKAKVMLDVVPTETNKDGMVSAKFDANTTFDAVINATGYVEKVKHVDIKNPQNSAVITDTVYLSIDKNRRIVLKNIYYDFDKWDILPESAVELDKLVDFMKQNPQLKVELSSHTDCRGSDKYNMRLSEKRAKSAVDYIVSKGVDVSRITAVGYGETRPVNKCVNGVQCSEQEHRQNRRTEVYIQDYGKAEDIVQTKGKH